MILEVLDIKDNDDGSAILTVDMDYETLKTFAGIGIIKALKDSAEEVINAQNLDKVNNNPSDPKPDVAAQYLDDAIKVLENRMTDISSACDQKYILDTLTETCQNALEILIVARSFLDNNKT